MEKSSEKKVAEYMEVIVGGWAEKFKTGKSHHYFIYIRSNTVTRRMIYPISLASK